MPYLVHPSPRYPSSAPVLTHLRLVADTYLKDQAYTHATYVPITSRAWGIISKRLGRPSLVLRRSDIHEDAQSASDPSLPRIKGKERTNTLESWKYTLKDIYREKKCQNVVIANADIDAGILAWNVDAMVVGSLKWEDFVGKKTLLQTAKSASATEEWEWNFDCASCGRESDCNLRCDWNSSRDIVYDSTSNREGERGHQQDEDDMVAEHDVEERRKKKKGKDKTLNIVSSYTLYGLLSLVRGAAAA